MDNDADKIEIESLRDLIFSASHAIDGKVDLEISFKDNFIPKEDQWTVVEAPLNEEGQQGQQPVGSEQEGQQTAEQKEEEKEGIIKDEIEEVEIDE